MSVDSPRGSNRSDSSSRASSNGSSELTAGYELGPAPLVQTVYSSSLSPPPSNISSGRPRSSSSGNSSDGRESGSVSGTGSNRDSSPEAPYSEIDPTDLDAVLVRAAWESPHRIIELLDKSADPHARSKTLGLTFMHRLVSNPKVQPELLNRIIRHLDENDVKTLVGAGNSFDITPLHYCIRKNLDTAAKITEILLEHGADPGPIEGNGRLRQPLHFAALTGNKDVVEVLLRYKDQLNLDHRDSEESTALDNACWKGHVEVVKLLCEAGSDIHVRDEYGWTPLRSAAQYGDDNIVNYLLDKGADIASVDNDGLTPLHAAARDRQITVLETLLRRGANINVKDASGSTPLHIVSWNDYEQVATILVTHGAAIEEGDNEGLTPLMAASKRGSDEMVHFLLTHGADMDRKDLKGNTALDHANLVEGRIMHHLIMKGSYSDKPNELGQTPLMGCALRGYKNAVEVLIEKGADLSKRDLEGWTPLITAVHAGAIEIVEHFLNEHLEKVLIDAQTVSGRTALIHATNIGHIETVLLLLEKKASVHLTDWVGGTALHHAASYGRPEMAALLLEHGATVDAVDDRHETPFSVLCDTSPDRGPMEEVPKYSGDENVSMPWIRFRRPIVSGQWVETMHVLLDAGADPNSANTDNYRPLHHAASWNELGRFTTLVDRLPPHALYLLNDDEETPLGVALDQKSSGPANYLLCRMTTADFGPQLGSDHEAKYLLWAAGCLETHELARLLFSKSIKFENDPKRYGWSAMDWAAYRGMPEVLWALLCSVEDTPDTTRQRKSALQIAKQRQTVAGLGRKRPTQKAQAANTEAKGRRGSRVRGGDPGKRGAKLREPQGKANKRPVDPTDNNLEELPYSPVEFSPIDRGRNMRDGWPTLQSDEPQVPVTKRPKPGGKHQETREGKGQKGYKDDKWGLIVDMLRDPPIIQTSGPKEPFEAPKDEDQNRATLEEYEAAMVDFYAGGGGTGFLRRFRSLRETIYEDGPHEIMKQARETMQHVSSEMIDEDDESRVEKQKIYTKKDLQFTWIHLPANNVSIPVTFSTMLVC